MIKEGLRTVRVLWLLFLTVGLFGQVAKGFAAQDSEGIRRDAEAAARLNAAEKRLDQVEQLQLAGRLARIEERQEHSQQMMWWMMGGIGTILMETLMRVLGTRVSVSTQGTRERSDGRR